MMVPAPAMPSRWRLAQRWKRMTAAFVWPPKPPSIEADGKPCQASRNCNWATSNPVDPESSARDPSRAGPAARARRASAGRGPRRPNAGPPLKRADSRPRAGTCEAVDRARVETLGAKADLEGSDPRRAHAGGLRCGWGDERNQGGISAAAIATVAADRDARRRTEGAPDAHPSGFAHAAACPAGATGLARALAPRSAGAAL